MSSSQQEQQPDDEQPEPMPVDLVWQTTRTTDGSTRIVVSLQERRIHDVEAQQQQQQQQSPPPVSSSVDNNDHNNCDDPQQEAAVPESVLIYERQLRKAQHARKVGRAVHPDQDLRVIYADEAIVVTNKPPGVLTVPGLNDRSNNLLHLVHAAYCADDNVPASQLIAHRLDMDTSGLVVFGRTAAATAQLHTAFRRRACHKEYECLVVGHWTMPEQQTVMASAAAAAAAAGGGGGGGGGTAVNASNNAATDDDDDDDDEDSNNNNLPSPPPESFLIDLPLQKDHEHPPFMRVSTPASERAAMRAVHDLQNHGWKKLIAKKCKPSQTLVTVLERGYRDDNPDLPYTRLRLVPITGRTHQLRVHCAALGFPIVGDPTYSLYGEAAPVGGLQDVPSVTHNDNQVDGVKGPKIVLPRCPLAVQKAWTEHHPPNERPMCLHAALLELPHPVTGDRVRWEVPPDF